MFLKTEVLKETWNSSCQMTLDFDFARGFFLDVEIEFNITNVLIKDSP